MSHSKGRYNKGQEYVAFTHVMILDKLHIVNYTRDEICVPGDVEGEKTRLCSKILLSQPVPMIHTMSHDYMIVLHLNIAGLQIKDLMSFNKICIAISHTISNSMLSLDDRYEIFQCDRNRNVGRVMFMVCKSLKPVRIMLDTEIGIVLLQAFIPDPM